jgi:pimeloyl-ACP methyl ester carboxylesterase
MTAMSQIQHEEAFFFENEGQKLFGVLHTPPIPDRRGGLIFCGPYGEEKHFSHRTFVDFARTVCSEGFYVLRFDYRGDGDSEGERENTTAMGQLSDIKRAIELMGHLGISALGLLGLRLGGTLAALAANSDPRIEFLVLWAPIVRPKEHFNGLLGLIELQQCSLNRRAYAEFSKIDLTDPNLRFNGEFFMADVTRDSRKYNRAVKGLSDVWAAGGDRREFKIIEEAEFWSPAYGYQKMFPHSLCDATMEWLIRERGRREQ